MNILSKIITKAITKPALRGKVRPLPTGGQRTQMESLGLTKAPEDMPVSSTDMPVSSTDMPVSSDVNYTPTRADQGQPMATSDEEGMFNTAQRNRMDLIYGNDIDEPSLIQPLSDAPTRADQGQPMAPQPQRIDVVPPVRTEMDEFVPTAGGSGGGKNIDVPITGGGDGDGIDFAGQRFSKAPDVDESKDALELADIETVQKGDFKTPRKKDLQKAARQLEEGTITGKQYRQIAKEQSPIEPFTEVPEPATFEKIAAVLKGEGALGIKKLLNGLIGFNRNIEQGVKVLSRLDIPAYNNFNTWIATVTHKGKSMYGPTAVLKNVEFKPHTTPSLKIAKGEGSKQPFATMSGNWQNMSSKDIRKFVEDNDILEKSLDDANEEWVQVGFNPERHGFFYHKSGKNKGRPIFNADEMIQIGALVLARKPKKPSLTQLKKLKVKGVNAIFNKGGVVDMRKGGKVGAAVVAASLMASGGQASASAFSPSKEFVEYIRSVENAGKKGYDKDTGLWHPFPPTGDVGEDMEEIYAGIVRPKGGSPLTQEAAEKLLGKRMQDAFKVAERVVDKRMKPGTFYRLPQRKKEVFVDYAFNMSEENFAKYKNFIPALVNDDKEGVEKEYIRNMRDENDNLIPLGRNKTFKKFFTEFFPERERSRASHSFSYFPKQTIL